MPPMFGKIKQEKIRWTTTISFLKNVLDYEIFLDEKNSPSLHTHTELDDNLNLSASYNDQ